MLLGLLSFCRFFLLRAILILLFIVDASDDTIDPGSFQAFLHLLNFLIDLLIDTLPRRFFPFLSDSRRFFGRPDLRKFIVMVRADRVHYCAELAPVVYKLLLNHLFKLLSILKVHLVFRQVLTLTLICIRTQKL